MPNCVLGVLDIPALLIVLYFLKEKIDREKENNNKVEQVKSVFTRRRRRGTTAAEQVGSVLMGPFHHDVAKIVNKFSTHGQAQSSVWCWRGSRVVGRSLRSEGHSGRKVTQVGRLLEVRKVGQVGRLVVIILKMKKRLIQSISHRIQSQSFNLTDLTDLTALLHGVLC